MSTPAVYARVSAERDDLHNAFHDAWGQINRKRIDRARNEYEVGYNQAIEQALLILEELGVDPEIAATYGEQPKQTQCPAEALPAHREKTQ